MSSCNQQQVPVVFAMNRRRLAVVLKKKFNIGCVGVFNYSGAEVCVHVHVTVYMLYM